jgi:hypothetical protein
MAWHDETPWASKRREAAAIVGDRLAKIREVLVAVDAGAMAPAKALDQIEDIARGEAERIVKVGNTHRPEVQS